MMLKCPACDATSFHNPTFMQVTDADGNLFTCPLCDCLFTITNIPAMPAVFVTEVEA